MKCRMPFPLGQNCMQLPASCKNSPAMHRAILPVASMIRRYLFTLILLTVFHLSRATEKEKTLAMIKPDGLAGNYSDEIKKMALASGFNITKEMITQLDEDTARSFYAEHFSKKFFPSLVKYMTSGPVLIMALEKHNAVSDWRNLIGPTDAGKAKITHPHSIRAMCGISTERNCVHGSDSIKSASREISFFFDFEEKRHDEL